MAIKYMTPRQLRSALNDGGEIALLDVREAGQFGMSHLLFATPLTYSRLELDIGALVPRKSVRIVLCDDGALDVAELAAKRLSALGYSELGVLDGGTRAWSAAGFQLFAGVNVPSKLFGELVEHTYHTPRVSVTELARMRQAGEDFVVVDGRPYDEYHKMNIPGGICCPNAELPYRIRELVGNPQTKIVVNCAGRTRSIMGAQTLINFGVSNPVYALENGTQGWVLAGMELERGATRRYPARVNESSLPALQAQAHRLMERHGVRAITASEFSNWARDAERTTYLLDVRTPEEFRAGSLAGAIHAPGGQLIQAADKWVGVRNARIVLIDDDDVRAPVVASWLKQLGCEVYVLEDGMTANVSLEVPAKPALPKLAPISAAALRKLLDRGGCAVVDLGSSMRYRETHIPTSQWSIRSRIVESMRNAKQPLILIADDPDVARIAALDLIESGVTDVQMLEGGFAAWVQSGYAVESSPDAPPDSECIDYLFLMHDRHAGNREAMKQYLAWETGLIAQLDDEERKAFGL